MIVLSLLRQALGTGQAPSNQVLLGLSLFLTIFIMMPVFEKVNTEAVQPYLEEKIDVPTALTKASEPFRQFMLKQTREADLELFIKISGHSELQSAEDVPFSLLLSAYVTSELKTAFQIGFLNFPAVSDYRSGGCQCVDVHGYDDAVADDCILAL